MYEDLMQKKMASGALAALKQCDKNSLERVRHIFQGIPQDYINFLREIGAGEIGRGQYNLYTGVVEPEDVYGEVPPGFEKIVLFGDDMQGFCSGFDTTNWKIIEIDPTNMKIAPAANSFESFIRHRINSSD